MLNLLFREQWNSKKILLDEQYVKSKFGYPFAVLLFLPIALSFAVGAGFAGPNT